MCTYMFKKIYGDKVITNKDVNHIIENYGYDPFEIIENFIANYVIPKYNCLTTVHRSYQDECGFPTIEFYIRYNVKLSLMEELKLDDQVVGDIWNFCQKNGLDDAFNNCTIYVTVSGDVHGQL